MRWEVDSFMSSQGRNFSNTLSLKTKPEKKTARLGGVFLTSALGGKSQEALELAGPPD